MHRAYILGLYKDGGLTELPRTSCVAQADFELPPALNTHSSYLRLQVAGMMDRQTRGWGGGALIVTGLSLHHPRLPKT